MACAICETRRPKRFCPGVRGDICTICCGTEREVTVDCPLDCPYLQEARLHEKPPAERGDIPNADIRVTEDFLRSNEELLTFLGQAIARSAFETPGAVDFDTREALESLVRSYRTLQSGLYYESLPANPLAANIHHRVQEAIGGFRQEEQRRLGMSKTRDADALGMLAFFQRAERARNNGRRRGRAFLDSLREFYPDQAGGGAAPAASPLVLP
jgi:hypothetical protein